MPNYNPYFPNNNYYMQNLQQQRDALDNQIRQMQQSQQATQPTNLTQNFQLAPQTSATELEGQYADNIDEVKNKFVTKTAIFVTRDFSNLWVKDISGNIKTFNTIEVIDLDDKDKEILMLRKEIGDLKEAIQNVSINKPANTELDEPIENKKSTRISTRKQSNAK